jgi:hypothetical protein
MEKETLDAETFKGFADDLLSGKSGVRAPQENKQAKKAAAKKAAAKKPAAKKRSAKQPASKKAAAKQSGGQPPE